MAALAMNIILTSFLFLLFRPKPIIIYWCLFAVGYWHIIIFSQPRTVPPSMSAAFADFLPGLFMAYGVWRVAFRFVLPTFMVMPLEATVWYIGPFWVGVLANVTFSKIPINRLLASDIRSRPGALTALLIIVVVVLVIVLNQARVIRKTGWLPHYVGLVLCRRAGAARVGASPRLDVEAPPLHRCFDTIACYGVSNETVCDLSSVPARACRQRWSGFRVGFNLADRNSGSLPTKCESASFRDLTRVF
jgi:hypothetical protein